MTVEVKKPDRLGPDCGVMAAERGLQLRALAVTGELGQLAAQRLDLRSPVQAQEPTQIHRTQPGRAFGAGLTEQRHEHGHQQDGAQPVKALTHRREGPLGDLEQPGHLQRRQHQQQTSQRQVRTLGDHHRRLEEIPGAGRRTLSGARHRTGKHPQLSNSGCTVLATAVVVLLVVLAVLAVVLAVVDDRRADIAVGDSDRRLRLLDRVRGPRGDPAQRDPHRGCGDITLFGDLQQGQAGRLQRHDPRCQGLGELARLPRTGPFRHQREHPAFGERPHPPPHRGLTDTERSGDVGRRGDPGAHQLHRSQPAAGLVAGRVVVRREPEHEHHAAVRTLQQTR